jgi:hypothetical protein
MEAGGEALKGAVTKPKVHLSTPCRQSNLKVIATLLRLGLLQGGDVGSASFQRWRKSL